MIDVRLVSDYVLVQRNLSAFFGRPLAFGFLWLVCVGQYSGNFEISYCAKKNAELHEMLLHLVCSNDASYQRFRAKFLSGDGKALVTKPHPAYRCDVKFFAR